MFKVKSVQAMSDLKPKATYLLLISPEQIPHLVVVSEGRYYSLTNRKSVFDADFESYYTFLKRSKRKVLFLELDVDTTDLKSHFEKIPKSGYSKCHLFKTN